MTFKYDPFGRRIYKSSSAGTSVYAYDGDNLIEETNSSGAAVARYSQGLNIDEPLVELRSSTTSFYQADGLGWVTSLTNAAGTVANSYTYDSFGNLVASSGSIANNFRYTGREWDSETSLYYYRARYYDQASGRFLREDPARDGINLYRYVQSDPVNGTDPFGLWDSYSHSALFWNALKACGADSDTIWQIQQYSVGIDQTQGPWDAYIHSMRAPGQAPAAAQQESSNWINSNLSMAQAAYLSPSQPGGRARAPWTMFFAYAVHTLTDATSPAHMQNGVPIMWPSNPAQHGDFPGSIETWKDMTPQLMQQNVQAIQKAYEQVTGKKCGCQK